ncbi:MAG: hypothetical protein ACI3VE_07750 [Oscillospiraceae bacterium]
MISKNQWRIIALTAAAALLIAAFLTGVTGFMDNMGAVKEAGSAYTEFHDELESLRENDGKLAEGKSEYESSKSAYDSEYAAYEAEYGEYEAADRKYNEDVLEYNRQLIAYSVGKNALSGAGALSEGKSQLEAGWAAYNEGKAAYDAGAAEFQKQKQEYEKGVSMYEYMLSAIEGLEASGMSHEQALQAVGAQAGIELSDEYIAEMKAGLDTAQALIPEAEAKLAEGKAKLDTAYDKLMQGEAGLEAAEAQISAAKSQLESIGSSIAGGPARLDADGKTVSETRAALEEKKSALDAEAEELSVYEDIQEKVSRARDKLIDEGFGTAQDDTAKLLSSAGAHEDKLHGDYLRSLISYILTYAGQLLAVAAAAAALLLLGKKRFPAAMKLSCAAVVLGVVSVVSSLVFGDVSTLAFAAAVCAAAGVGLSREPSEDA